MIKTKRFYLIVVILLFVQISFSQATPDVEFTGTQELCAFSEANFTNLSSAGDSPIVGYSWNFGDGSNSTDKNPTHIYSTPGTYTVTLVVQTADGGAGSKVKVDYVLVHPKPNADFETSTNGCTIPVDVTFSNNSGSGLAYEWDFGNNETSTLDQPPVVHYSSAGTYETSLIVTNSFGCKDTMIKSIIISDFQAGITAPEIVCVGSEVEILDNSTVGVNEWNWSFAGGSPNASANENVIVKYDTPGQYVISLTSKNTISGCVSSVTKTITVAPKPEPTFTNSPIEGCAPLDVTFNNTGSETGAHYEWDFGNGQTSTLLNPVTTYIENDVFTVKLIMTDINGCVDSISQEAVSVDSPHAYFTSNIKGGCADLDVHFIDTSLSNDPITSWDWDFGNGDTYSGQTPPVQTFPTGTYDVTLIVNTANGCADTIMKPDFIQVGEIDSIDFTIDSSPECAKRLITFTSFVDISVPYEDSEIVYNWIFGDGGTSSMEDPFYQYAKDTGYFSVILNVNFRGCQKMLKKTDSVYIKAPIAKFFLDTTLYCNPTSLPITLETDDRSILGSASDDYEMNWKWGDNTPDTHLSKTDLDLAGNGDESHQYYNYGTYYIEQVVTNHTTGCSDSIKRRIDVTKTEAIIDYVSNDSICVGDSISVTQNSTSTNIIDGYNWQMGDDTIYNAPNVTHMYQTPGNYSIRLMVYDGQGCSDIDVYTPLAVLAPPTAAFGANSLGGCPPFEANLTNGSTVNGNGAALGSFLFSFPDDGSTETTTSLTTDVTHTFDSIGTYHVTMIATDDFGCVSEPATIEINVTKPSAMFEVDSVVCADEELTTVNTSYGGEAPLSYEWFVDGVPINQNENYTTSYSGNPDTMSTTVNYELIVTDDYGCKDTLEKDVIISTPIASADYSLSGAAINSGGEYTCPPVFADFLNTSQDIGAITDFVWSFSEGKTSVLENPSNTYVFPDTYSFSLSITDEFGCTSDTTYNDFLTINGPTGVPSWEQFPGECNENVTFHLKDTTNVSTIIWNFDDSMYMNDSMDVNHHYMGYGDFKPTVILKDENNCTVEYPMDPIFIENHGVHAGFHLDPSVADLGEEVVITDASTSSNSTIESWTWLIDGYNPIINLTGESSTVSYIQSGYYYVTLIVENDFGCVDTAIDKIHVTSNFTMPNVFTPNGDGDNDYFTLIDGIFKTFDIVILNRWGNVIIDKKAITGIKLWDGRTMRGEMCTDGVYFYKINGTLLDGSPGEDHGFFHLIDGKE